MITIIKPGRFVEAELTYPKEALPQLEGYFKLRAIKNGHVMREMEFSNLITNGGMNRLRTAGRTDFMFQACQIGTGTATPLITDTALTNYSAGFGNVSNTVGVAGSSPYYGWRNRRYLSSVGALNGNYTEIGISDATSAGNLFSKALIVNNIGVPTAFTVNIDEQLEVYWELRVYVPLTDFASSITISGTAYSTVTRALAATGGVWQPNLSSGQGFFDISGANMYTGALAAITASVPAGSALGAAGSNTMATYVSGSYTNVCTHTWSPAQGNGTVRTLSHTFATGSFQTELTPTFVKLNTQTLILGSSLNWSRY